jgi:hypothetical protein
MGGTFPGNYSVFFFGSIESVSLWLEQSGRNKIVSVFVF